jgi:hypothetical protein
VLVKSTPPTREESNRKRFDKIAWSDFEQ